MNDVNTREARLVPTLLNVLVAGLSDPSRLSRGRTYARQGAVIDLEVDPGLLTGAVQGSRSRPYEVAVEVRPATSFDSLTGLVPDAAEVEFDCSCPDWEIPCKHAVAVMLAFAERVGHEPDLLAEWRGLTAEPGAGTAIVGSRAGGQSSVPLRPSFDEVAIEVLRTFLGESVDEPVPAVPPLLDPLPRPDDVWAEPWAAMLADALTALARASR